MPSPVLHRLIDSINLETKEICLKEAKLSKEDFQKLNDTLLKYPHINSLILWDVDFNPDDLMFLNPGLKHLAKLALIGSEIGTNKLKNLIPGLGNSSITELTLAGCDLVAEDCNFLARILHMFAIPIKKLVLRNNKISDDGVWFLANLIANSRCKIEYLDLSDNALTVNAAFFLLEALKFNPQHLTTLLLADNYFSDAGADYFSFLLCEQEHGVKIKTLDLSNNRITHRGADLISLALSETTSLQELYLSNNPLGKEGGDYLLSQLACMPRIVYRYDSVGYERNDYPLLLKGEYLKGFHLVESLMYRIKESALLHALDLNFAPVRIRWVKENHSVKILNLTQTGYYNCIFEVSGNNILTISSTNLNSSYKSEVNLPLPPSRDFAQTPSI